MSSFGSALCHVNNPSPLLDAHFSKNGPLRNEPKKKLHRAAARAQRRLQEASSDDHIRRGAPGARRTRIWRRAAANAHKATHPQRPQLRKRLHRAEARAQFCFDIDRYKEGLCERAAHASERAHLKSAAHFDTLTAGRVLAIKVAPRRGRSHFRGKTEHRAGTPRAVSLSLAEGSSRYY